MYHQNRIAWARSGLLAYIDGEHKVHVTWLQCVDGEKWDYVPPVHIQAAAESKPVHLSWSTTNFDLAVADELGRVHIVSISPLGVPNNQIVASAVRDQRQRPAELDRLVGVHWLDSEKSLIIPRSSNNEQGKPWESVAPVGPFHPMKSRSALLGVNGNGMLRFLVQTPDYQYSEIDALMPGASYVSHAHFMQMGGDSLLIFIANGDNTLVAYEAAIKWKPENLKSKQDFVNISHVRPVASIPLPHGERLKTLVALRQIGGNPPTDSSSNMASSVGSIMIRAVYPHSVEHYSLKAEDEPLHNSFIQLRQSISEPIMPDPTRVWRLEHERTESHSREIMEYVVNKIVVVVIYANGDVERESLVDGVSLLQFDKVGLALEAKDLINPNSSSHKSNGSAHDTSNPEAMAIDSASNSSNSIGNFANSTDTGNGTSPTVRVTSICLSPTTSCAAIFYDNTPAKDMPKLISSQPALPDGNKESQARHAQNMAMTLATSYACTVFNSEQCDDVMSVCWNVLHNASVAENVGLIFNTLASETQRLLNVQLSAPEDPQKVERLVVIPSPSQRWLSFLIALGTSGHWSRTPGCYAALSLLHLQLLAFGLTWTLKRIAQKSRAQSVAHLRLEIQASQFHLASILGPVRWATDLIVRISQEIYDAVTSTEKTINLIKQPNVFISLLLSGVARYLLRYFLRCIRSLSASAKNLAEQETRLNSKISQAAQLAKDPSLAQELRTKLASPSNYTATRTLKKLVAQLQAVPIKLDAFEKVIVSLEENVKTLVAKHSLTEEQRNAIDSDLIKTAKIPPQLAPLIKSLIDSSQSMLFPFTNIPNLYFHDTAWLGLDKIGSEELIDGLRKRIILPQEQVQRCTRCGMKSVVTPDQPKQVPQWLVLFQRHCVCGGSWLRDPDM